jgi:hypothetical protein
MTTIHPPQKVSSMLDKNIYILVLLGMVCALFSAQAQQEIEASHPIHTRQVFFSMRRGTMVHAPMDQILKWSFEPDKARYLLGEPVTGVLSVSNVTRSLSVEMSPPYNGQYVSTVGVWTKMHRPSVTDFPRLDQWRELRESIRINKGNYHHRTMQFQGKPIILAPGDQFTTKIALNVVQPEAFISPKGGDQEWYSGIGFEKPGHYTVFFRYINLEAVMPYSHRGQNSSTLEHARSLDNIVLLSDKPHVMGPYEIEIAKLGQDNTQLFSEKFSKWQAKSDFRASTVVPTDEDISKMLSSIAKDDTDLETVSTALTLSQIRIRFSNLLALDQSGSHQREAFDGIRVEILGRLDRMQPGFLQESYSLTLCHVLIAMKEVNEARKVATKLATPDAVVLLQQLQGTNGSGAKNNGD